MGIRLALGAPRRDVLSLVLLQGMRLVAAGVTVGLAGSLLLTKLLRTLLFQVSPGDPLVHATIVVLLVAVALVATFLPARRAAALDPYATLKAD